MSQSEEKQSDDGTPVDASWRDPAALDLIRRIIARQCGMVLYLWPIESEHAAMPAHCPNCGDVAHRLWNKQKRRYEFACVERTCYERWTIVKGVEVRL